MSSACFDRDLLLRATLDTGINATMLAESLSPLCSTITPVDTLAAHPGTVFIAYFCGFLPWGFLVLIDFISADWKTLQNTRKSGYLHLTIAIIPMMVVIAYASLQALSRDYKEMMTAITALVLSLYHVARTFWGLAQLRSYKTWCEDTLKCIRALSPGDSNLSDVNLDEKLMVNHEIVDNEFISRDVTVKIDGFFNWKLSNPELCTVRWTASFLCSLGHEFSTEFGKEMDCLLTTHRGRSIWFLTYTTFSIKKEPNETTTLFSIRQCLDDWCKNGIPVGAFNSSIVPFRPDFALDKDMPHHEISLNPFDFEVQNVVSSYPTYHASQGERNKIQSNRQSTNIAKVETVLMAKYFGQSRLNLITKRRRKFSLVDSSKACNLLCNQLGTGEEEAKNIKSNSPFWNTFLVPLWDQNCNNDVLQASAHADIYIALKIGKTLYIRVPMDPHASNFNSFQEEVTEKLSFMPFNGFFLGVGLDSVREFLAKWRNSKTNTNIPHADWTPQIPKGEFHLNFSDFVCKNLLHDTIHDAESKFHLKSRLIWECQYALQTWLSSNSDKNHIIPICKEPMMLFLCSYPCLHAEYRTDLVNNKKVLFKIKPVCTTQAIFIEGEVDVSNGEAVLRMEKQYGDLRFSWQDWINSAMGIMKGFSELWKTSNPESSMEVPSDLMKPVDLAICMQRTRITNQFTVTVWTGWPMFDPRINQFERKQIREQWERCESSGRTTSKWTDIENELKKIAIWETKDFLNNNVMV